MPTSSATKTRLLLLATAVACQGTPEVEDTPSVEHLSGDEICDGSDEVRLYLAFWTYGSGSELEDLVHYAEGIRFLKVDGHCRFYAYEGEREFPTRWHTPTYTGTLSPQQATDLSDFLHTGNWAHFADSDLAPATLHDYEGWTRFLHPSAQAECIGSCQGSANAILGALPFAIDDLVAQGEPMVPDLVEVGLVPQDRQVYAPVPWEAVRPVEEMEDDPDDAYLSGDSADIGTFVRVDDDPWYWNTHQEWITDTAVHSAAATINVAAPGHTETTHIMGVRAVSPPAWPSNVEELDRLGLLDTWW